MLPVSTPGRLSLAFSGLLFASWIDVKVCPRLGHGLVEAVQFVVMSWDASDSFDLFT